MANLYTVLGVTPDADANTIRQAYRDLARRHHPDAGGDTSDMAGLNEAWHVLSESVRRASYDAQLARPRARHAPRDGRTVMDFGRYEGWSLAEIANYDEDYLEWFRRTPTGRGLRSEIGDVLERRAAAMSTLRPQPSAPGTRWSRFTRR